MVETSHSGFIQAKAWVLGITQLEIGLKVFCILKGPNVWWLVISPFLHGIDEYILGGSTQRENVCFSGGLDGGHPIRSDEFVNLERSNITGTIACSNSDTRVFPAEHPV